MSPIQRLKLKPVIAAALAAGTMINGNVSRSKKFQTALDRQDYKVTMDASRLRNLGGTLKAHHDYLKTF
jgi:outer membrane murein-binding lipoprotein Lpp